LIIRSIAPVLSAKEEEKLGLLLCLIGGVAISTEEIKVRG